MIDFNLQSLKISPFFLDTKTYFILYELAVKIIYTNEQEKNSVAIVMRIDNV